MAHYVPAEDMVDVIREAGRSPVTEGDIAEEVGVSKQTVANRREEIKETPGVQFREIDRANAYWWDPPGDGDTAPFESEGGRPPEDVHVPESDVESDSSEPRDPMMLPGVFLLMLAIVGPVYFLLALLDGTVLDRLRETLEVSTSESEIHRTRYGRSGVYLAGLVAALGLILGVGAGILVLDVGVGVGAWVVRVTLGIAGMTILGSTVAAYNAMPAWDGNDATPKGN